MATPNETCPPVTENCNDKPTLTFAHDLPPGPYTPPTICTGTLDYSTSECADMEANYLASLIAESLNAAAGPVNIFPLLGVHSQGSTIDQVGDGFPLSSGTPSGYNALDAFNVELTSWRSIQQGSEVVSIPAYIGYDFGTKKAWEAEGTPRERYEPPAPIRKRISTIKIKQGLDRNNRVAQARIEASDDGLTWKRVDIVTLPDSAALVTVPVKSTAAYNKWRIVPTFFNGVASNSQWEVVEIQLLEQTQVALDNIEDFILLENRDRSYCRTSSMLKCHYDLLDVQTELAKFGINLPQTYIFQASFAMMIQVLGRPVVVGDIIELPGEAQYDPMLRPVRKWLEVTDTGWSTEGYAFNWKPQIFRFYAQPILPSIEHKDILGVPGQVNATQSDDDVLSNGFLQNDQAFKSTEAIVQAAKDAVPLAGADAQNIKSGKPLIGTASEYDGRDMYSEDAIPPDGAPYTVGDVLPLPTTIADGHYHRQTYTNVSQAIRPPDRLLRWYEDIQRWKVIEVNKRVTYQSHKPSVSKILDSSTKIAPDKNL